MPLLKTGRGWPTQAEGRKPLLSVRPPGSDTPFKSTLFHPRYQVLPDHLRTFFPGSLPGNAIPVHQVPAVEWKFKSGKTRSTKKSLAPPGLSGNAEVRGRYKNFLVTIFIIPE
jgi:hypothetical protein